MKRLFYLFLLSVLSISSCKEESVNQEIPYTTLANLSEEPNFSFSIKSSTVGKLPTSPKGEPNKKYLVVINDKNTYLDDIITSHEHPLINFSTHTLFAFVLEYRGKVTFKTRNDGDKTILTVNIEVPELGPQGTVYNTFSAIVPKVDSANVIMNVNYINVK